MQENINQLYHAFKLTLIKNNIDVKLNERNSSKTVSVAIGTPLKGLGVEKLSIPQLTKALF